MQVNKYFSLQEFVDPETYNQLGDKSIWLIDQRIIHAAELIRIYFGVPVTINNWHTGGSYHESGLRSFNTTTGAKYSQHKMGRAVDLKIQGFDYEDVRKIIRVKYNEWGITTIEKDTPTWVHIDCRNTRLTTLLEVPFK